MSELMIFEGYEVEVFELNEQILFNPKHVAEALGIVDVNSTIRNFSDRQITKLRNSDMQTTHIRKLNNAGENFLTEAGVYKLVMRSNKPDAEKFQDWVTDEVLPALRKRGHYTLNSEQAKTNAVEDGVRGITSKATLDLMQSLLTEQRLLLDENERLLAENEEMKPKADYFDELVECSLLTSIRDTAKELKVKQTKFVDWLLRKKYVYRDQQGKLKPYAAHIDVLFELKEFTRPNYSDVQTLVTPKGRATFRLLLKDEDK